MKRGILKVLLPVFLLAFLFSFLPLARASYQTPSNFTESGYLSAVTDSFQSVQKMISNPEDPFGPEVPNTDGLASALSICRDLFYQHFGTDQDAIAIYFGPENNETQTIYSPAFPGDDYTRDVIYPAQLDLVQNCSYTETQTTYEIFVYLYAQQTTEHYFYVTTPTPPSIDVTIDGQSPTCPVQLTQTEPVLGTATGCWQYGPLFDTLTYTTLSPPACNAAGRGTFYSNHYGITGTQQVQYTEQQKCALEAPIGNHVVNWTVGHGVNTTETVTANSWPLGTPPGSTEYSGPRNINFSQVGTYNYAATATNGDGSNSDNETIHIIPGPVTCAPATQTVLVGDSANFTAGGGDGSNYTWTATGGAPASGTGASFATSYASFGSGTKSVTVSSNSTTATCSVSLTATNLSVALTANPTSGTTPLTSSLTATVTSNLSGTTNYKIWYDCPSYNSATHGSYTYSQMKTLCSGGNDAPYAHDSYLSDTDNRDNTYSGAGTYRAVVLVEKGSSVASNYADVTVYPALACSPATQTVDVNQNATITVTGGNGTFAWSGGGTPATGSGASFVTKYPTGGTKPITVTSAGATNSNCRVEVNAPPVVVINPQPPGVGVNYCAGLTANVAWQYSDSSGSPQSAFQVQIDDQGSFQSPVVDSCPSGTSSGTCTAGHTTTNWTTAIPAFNTTYKARVRAWNSNGVVSDWAVSNTWQTPAHAYPAVSFNSAQLVGSKIVQFTDTTTYYDTGGSARSWQWDFDDSGSVDSALQNPSHEYPAYLNYTAKLSATDKQGYTCSATGTVQLKKVFPNWKEIVPKF